MNVSPVTVSEYYPVQWTDPNLSPEYWWLDVGPFFDRFASIGSPAIKLAVLTGTGPYCTAARFDALPRKYIDLKRTDLPTVLAGIGSEVPALTPEIQAAILSTYTTEYERYIKGLPQPQ